MQGRMCGSPGVFVLLCYSAVAVAGVTSAKVAGSGGMGGWNTAPNTQYHIQTDEGPERYFRYQTISGQYRKEKRLQDGTVVGTYGWVDPNGFLRLRDYVADNAGYRVVRTKMMFVGKDSGVEKNNQVVTTTTPAPPPSYPDISSNYLQYPSSTAAKDLSSGNANPYVLGGNAQYPLVSANRRTYDVPNYASASSNVPTYDGISATHNGFRYYLPRQYHEEENSGAESRAGSFGYIDPFGIRRVIYYNTAPGTGFVHRKNNRYVGFNATPYDPRY
ncbi:uncharacterized protein LOC110840497 isoform X1 [Zootermopsis nevadensis]|uniref:uncharacterized protein LOC110840497 isoform X1 n=1 Tax=Zootermopsis nevadensis TaxID=136037 RepID=UPI000B8E49C6|nr:uncharacterized protein LOC110840497 isoform X1 [Zootermopsis nevadensis]